MAGKLCRKCDETRHISQFHKNRAAKDGLSAMCKKCAGRYGRIRRRIDLPTKYGITANQYDQMLDERGPRCPICGTVNDNPRIDHCHKTGKVRGLICNRCNIGLGLFLDNPRALLRAAVYLKNAGQPGFPCTHQTLNDIAEDISRRQKALDRI